jgi:hypothetical protein
MLMTEWIGGHRFSHIDGWSNAYTDGQGCAGGSRGGVRSPIFLYVAVDDKFLPEKSSL